MPDIDKKTVSASQMPMLWGVSPYGTEWMLYHHFHDGIPMPEVDDDDITDRVYWGTVLEPVILAATARAYRLDVEHNTGRVYQRRGSLGATYDGVMTAPDVGRINVEAKNIDWLRWRQTWSADQAAPHVEIQTQIGTYAIGAAEGLIAALVGGNSLHFYRRPLDKELIQASEERARLFLEAVATSKEPDPLGSPLELPMLAQLYPKTVETEVVEDLEDPDLPGWIREFARSRDVAASEGRLRDQMKAKLLGKAKTAGILRANGVMCFIKRSPRGAVKCEPHTEEKILRKESSQVGIKVVDLDPNWMPSIQDFLRGA